MSKIVTRTIDLSNPPKLTDEAKARLAKLNEGKPPTIPYCEAIQT